MMPAMMAWHSGRGWIGLTTPPPQARPRASGRGVNNRFSLSFMASKSPVEALLGAGVVGACFFLLALLAQLLELEEL